MGKMERAGEAHAWTQHIQLRTPTEIWNPRGSVTTFQMWVAYRDATMQLNLFRPGRTTDASCPVGARCDLAAETIPHIMWDCKKAKRTWKGIFERWTGKKAVTKDLDLLLPHIASRSPPTTTQHIRAKINTSYGFFTPDHSKALQTIWFILSTAVPSALWRQRNATVHQQQAATVEESSEHAWRAVAHQIRAVASQRSTNRGMQHVGISMRQCLSVLEEPDTQWQPSG